jgi:hypothetical protein
MAAVTNRPRAHSMTGASDRHRDDRRRRVVLMYSTSASSLGERTRRVATAVFADPRRRNRSGYPRPYCYFRLGAGRDRRTTVRGAAPIQDPGTADPRRLLDKKTFVHRSMAADHFCAAEHGSKPP